MLRETDAVRTRRIRREPEEARQLILATAEDMMLKGGYAAVTMRGVAKQAGVSSALLHYYYPTLDGLLVALYRHTALRDLELLKNALAAADPIRRLWSYQTDPARAALGVEFLALANHKQSVRAEIAQFATRTRRMQAAAISSTLSKSDLSKSFPSPESIATLLTSVSRNLKMEESVGISLGHEDVMSFVERILTSIIDQ